MDLATDGVIHTMVMDMAILIMVTDGDTLIMVMDGVILITVTDGDTHIMVMDGAIHTMEGHIIMAILIMVVKIIPEEAENPMRSDMV